MVIVTFRYTYDEPQIGFDNTLLCFEIAFDNAASQMHLLFSCQ